LTEKCSNPTFITKLDNRRLKLEILAANTTLRPNCGLLTPAKLWRKWAKYLIEFYEFRWNFWCASDGTLLGRL